MARSWAGIDDGWQGQPDMAGFAPETKARRLTWQLPALPIFRAAPCLYGDISMADKMPDGGSMQTILSAAEGEFLLGSIGDADFRSVPACAIVAVLQTAATGKRRRYGD